jgi:hypothetical protein
MTAAPGRRILTGTTGRNQLMATTRTSRAEIHRDQVGAVIRWQLRLVRYNAKGEQTNPTHVEIVLAVDDSPELVALLAHITRDELPVEFGIMPSAPKQTRLDLAVDD